MSVLSGGVVMHRTGLLVFSALVAAIPLVVTPAEGADMLRRPIPAAEVAMAPEHAYDWTGFYAGAQAGGVWGRSHWSDFAGGPAFDTDGASALGGVQIGYNAQWDRFVLGVEGEFSGFSISGRGQCSSTVGTECRTRQNWIGAARLRGGYAFDRVLFYGTGGVAFTDYRFDQTVGGPQSWSGGSRVGWTAGLGLEYAFADRWTAGVEWKHYDFGKRTGSGGLGPTSVGFREANDVVVAKINYRF